MVVRAWSGGISGLESQDCVFKNWVSSPWGRPCPSVPRSQLEAVPVLLGRLRSPVASPLNGLLRHPDLGLQGPSCSSPVPDPPPSRSAAPLTHSWPQCPRQGLSPGSPPHSLSGQGAQRVPRRPGHNPSKQHMEVTVALPSPGQAPRNAQAQPEASG